MQKLLLTLMIVPIIGFGQCEGNCENGLGNYTYDSGDSYYGIWKDGQRHGLGTYYWTNGNYWYGRWKEGNRHGTGKMAYEDGDTYIG